MASKIDDVVAKLNELIQIQRSNPSSAAPAAPAVRAAPAARVAPAPPVVQARRVSELPQDEREELVSEREEELVSAIEKINDALDDGRLDHAQDIASTTTKKMRKTSNCVRPVSGSGGF